jgi:hypothetical protein
MWWRYTQSRCISDRFSRVSTFRRFVMKNMPPITWNKNIRGIYYYITWLYTGYTYNIRNLWNRLIIYSMMTLVNQIQVLSSYYIKNWLIISYTPTKSFIIPCTYHPDFKFEHRLCIFCHWNWMKFALI